MIMRRPDVAIIGKTIQTVARLRGGGSALPGLIVEKISPNFTRDILLKLPYGVVVISGTNGKTTTTKMVVELLQSQGLTVFTNRTGSNFSRGVTSSILEEVSLAGKLHVDIAVLELDEAHAVGFVDSIPPRYSLLLNVLRDQLDRFGEIDTTAKMLTHIAKKTTGAVVLNQADEKIAQIAKEVSPNTKTVYFGLSDKLKNQFPSDDNFKQSIKKSTREISNTNQSIDKTITSDEQKSVDGRISNPEPIVTLTEIFSDNKSAEFKIDGQTFKSNLSLRGIYNIYNAAAALTLTRQIVSKKINYDQLFATLAKIKPAFGRGEIITYKDQEIDIVLVKNPSGFQLALNSFSPQNTSTMFAINDNYADGRDVSWLWDVDFSSLENHKITAISGDRAYDMALRLTHDNIDQISKNIIDTNLESALDKFLADNSNQHKRIFCTYTAMLKIRKILSTKTKVERI